MPPSTKFWSIVTSRIFFIIAGLALLGVSTGIVKSVVRRVEVEREISALKNDIKSLEGKNEDLAKLINYFQTPEFKEREARLRLGLQKPGENVVVIPGLGENGPGVTNTSTESIFVPNWKKWVNYFFGQQNTK
jgi:cell division protein FtsB